MPLVHMDSDEQKYLIFQDIIENDSAKFFRARKIEFGQIPNDSLPFSDISN
jgi:hypothetical protein